MPRKTPKYALHKATGQARVRLNGKSYYLGKYDTEESRLKYEVLIGRWLANQELDASSLCCSRLALLYLDYARGYYVKDGKETSEVHSIRVPLRHLVKAHGNTLCVRFGPKALREVRQSMVEAGIVRESINSNIGRIRRAFKWAVGQELLPVEVWQRLTAVESLAKGRSKAKESEPIKPVPQELIDAVLPQVGRQIGAMIRLQVLTGMRPGEVVAMRGVDLQPTDGGMWVYRPDSHKTQHHGKERAIFIGPKAQSVLAEFLRANGELPLFTPVEARAEHNARRRAARKVKVWPSHEKRRPGEGQQDLSKTYSRHSYCQAIKRACERAGVPAWHPNQLRHNAATELRKAFGIEAARTVLGHGSMAVTEIYAEIDQAKAMEAMREIG